MQSQAAEWFYATIWEVEAEQDLVVVDLHDNTYLEEKVRMVHGRKEEININKGGEVSRSLFKDWEGGVEVNANNTTILLYDHTGAGVAVCTLLPNHTSPSIIALD